jgi:DNA-binding ferritin-like protein (Dps family)
MKMLAKLSNNGEIDNFASRKFNVIRKKLNREVRKDLDEHSYIVVNEILDALEKIKEDNRKLFEIIAKDLKEILLHQLVHEKDRYAARKLKQLQSL